MKWFLAAITLIVVISCTHEDKSNDIKTGIWRATIEIQGKQLPFNFELQRSAKGYQAYIINADERILLDEIKIERDSIDMRLHIFDANIKAAIKGDSLQGAFIKNYEKNYRIPFLAVYGQQYRFEKDNDQDSVPDFNGKYEVTFVDDKDTTQAIGIFKQVGDSVTGTFLTPTGDYRFLQGNVANGKMQLSTFDGNYAYLFSATKDEHGDLVGDYFSGKTYRATWTGIKNENATLPDPESLTYLKTGYEKIDFTFPDVDGNKVSLTDAKYKNKVVVLQLFGTWCPNCLDETRFLAPWYEENKERGIEIIGLAYERKSDFVYASERVKNMITKLGVAYDFVIAGTNDKAKAAETLPMLNSVVAFPTTIFIGKDGKVKKIHTGFSGPGTGVYYEQLVEDFNGTVNELLNEELVLLK